MTTRICFDCETTSLIENLFERITCICLDNIDKNEKKSFYGNDEKKIITEFFDYVKTQDNPCLIGYNSSSFDLVFLTRKSIVHKIPIPKFTQVDLRLIANGFFYSYNKKERGTLRDWALAFGMEIKTPPGSEMIKLYVEGKYEEIAAHCCEDLTITRRLFEHIKACGLID